MKVLKQISSLILPMAFVFSMQAQNNKVDEVEIKEELKNQFFILPTSLADKIVQFGYERKLANNKSVMLQLGTYINGSNVLENTTINGTGIRTELSYNILFDNLTKNDNNALNFYASPYINYFNSTFKIGKDHYNNEYASETTYDDSTGLGTTFLTSDSLSSDGKASISHMGLGTLIGLRWTISQKIVFDFYIGGGVQRADYDGEDKFKKVLQKEFIGNFTTTGVLGRGGIRLGILF